MAHNNKPAPIPSNTQSVHQPNTIQSPTEAYPRQTLSSDSQDQNNSTTTDHDTDSIISSTAAEPSIRSSDFLTNNSGRAAQENGTTNDIDIDDLETEAGSNFEIRTDSYAYTNPDDTSNTTTSVRRRPNATQTNINNNNAGIQFNDDSTDSNIRFEQDEPPSLEGSVDYTKPVNTADSMTPNDNESEIPAATPSLTRQHHTNNIAALFNNNVARESLSIRISRWFAETSIDTSEPVPNPPTQMNL